MSSRLRGINALYEDDSSNIPEATIAAVSEAIGTFPVLIEIDKITRSRHQPRKYFNKAKIAGMAEKFRKYRDRGEHPRTAILVRPIGQGYELVFGEQRMLAHKQAGFTQLLAFVDANLTEEEANELALDENLMREDLNPFEKTQAILQRAALLLGTTPEQIKFLLDKAAREQKQNAEVKEVLDSPDWQTLTNFFQSLPDPIAPESFRTNYLPLLNLPEDVQAKLQEGLEYTKARAIAKVKDEAQRQQLLQRVEVENLSIRELRDQIAQLNQSSTSAEAAIPSLRSRFDQTYRKSKKSSAWNDPKKNKKLEKLLSQLEELLELNAESDSEE